MWRFYTRVAWLMLKSFFKAAVLVEGTIAAVLFLFFLYNEEIGKQYLGWNWNGIDPKWAWAPIGIFTFHLFMRAIYEQHSALEAQLKEAVGKHGQSGNGTAAAIKVTIRQAIDAKYSAEWRKRTRSILRGALGNRYVQELDAKLWHTDSEISAKGYLEGLLPRVDGSFLTSSRRERQSEPRGMDAVIDMIWELIENRPQLKLKGRITRARHEQIIAWRDRCTDNLQRLYGETYKTEPISQVFGEIEMQRNKHEILQAIDRAADSLRFVYSMLPSMLRSNQ